MTDDNQEPAEGDDERLQLQHIFSFEELNRRVPWDLPGHIRTVYQPFRCRDGVLPAISASDGKLRAQLKQTLMAWNADLGARDKMDWEGFFEGMEGILAPLARFPRLGLLDQDQLEAVVLAVWQLDQFKHTKSGKLVFGSKAAHFVFPWLVPIVSSDVVRGIEDFRRRTMLIDGMFGRKNAMKFGPDPEENLRAYFEYLDFGDRMLETFDCQAFLAGNVRVDFGLDAKMYEWLWVSQDPGS